MHFPGQKCISTHAEPNAQSNKEKKPQTTQKEAGAQHSKNNTATTRSDGTAIVHHCRYTSLQKGAKTI